MNSYQWTTVSSTLRIPSIVPVVSEEFVKLTITTYTSIGARYKRSNPRNSTVGQGNQSKFLNSEPLVNSVGASNHTGSPSSRQPISSNGQGTPTGLNTKGAATNQPGSGSPVVPAGSTVPRNPIGSYLLPYDLRVTFILGNDTVHLDLVKNKQFGKNIVPVFTKFSDGSIVQHGLSAVKHVGSYYTDKDHTHNLHLECMSNTSSTCTHYKIFGSFEHNSDMHMIEPKVQPIDLGDECEHLHRVVKTDHINGVKFDHLPLTGVKNDPAPTSLPANMNHSAPTNIVTIPSNKNNSTPMNIALIPPDKNHSAPATTMSTPANNNHSTPPNITKIPTKNEHHTPMAVLPTNRIHSSPNMKIAPAKKTHRGSMKTKSVPAKKKLASSKEMAPIQAKHPTPTKITSIPAKKKRPVPKSKSLPVKNKIPTPKKITSIPAKTKHSTPKNIISKQNKNKRPAPKIKSIPMNKKRRTSKKITTKPEKKIHSTLKKIASEKDKKKSPAPKLKSIRMKKKHPTLKQIISIPAKTQNRTPKKIQSLKTRKKRPVPKIKAIRVKNKILTPKKIISIPAKKKHSTPQQITSEQVKKKRPAPNIKSIPRKMKHPTQITAIPANKKHSTPTKITPKQAKKENPTLKIPLKKKDLTPKEITSIPAKKTHSTPDKITSGQAKEKRPPANIKSITAKRKHRTTMKISSSPEKETHPTTKRRTSLPAKKKRPVLKNASIPVKKKQPTPKKITSIPAKKITLIPAKKKHNTPKKITQVKPKKESKASKEIPSKKRENPLPDEIIQIPVQKSSTSDKMKSIPERRRPSRFPSKTTKGLHRNRTFKPKADMSETLSSPTHFTRKHRRLRRRKRPKKKRVSAKNVATKYKRHQYSSRKKQRRLKKQLSQNTDISINKRKRKKHHFTKVSENINKGRSLAADHLIKDTSNIINDAGVSTHHLVTTGVREQHSKELQGFQKNKQNTVPQLPNESDTSHDNEEMDKIQEINKPFSENKTMQPHHMFTEPKPSAQTPQQEQFEKQNSKAWASIPGLKIPVDDVILPFDKPLPIIDKQISGNEERKYKTFYPQSKIKGVHHFGKFRDVVNTMWSENTFDREHGGFLENSDSLSKSELNSERASQVDTKINRLASILGQSNHRRKRATGSYNVEVFVIIDFPIYNFWLREENSNSDKALQRVREYYTFLLFGVDNRFKKMSASYRIGVNLVGIYVAKKSSDLSFIKNHLSNGILNADTALSAMKQWVQTNGIPRHDHIMTFTRYDMRSGSFDTSGTAYLNSICTTRSNSIVEERFDFIAATVAAHEIGHALGAVHDGDNNRCSASSGFIMVSISQAMRPPNQKSPWEFSSCTSSEIGLYLDELNKKGSHCMQRTHPSAKNFNAGSLKKLGQTFNVDKQCEFIIGKGSYACRSFIGNSENVCTGLWCKTADMSSTRCILALPAEGTTCGHNKWCIGSSCVYDSRAPSRGTADCAFGDSPGLVLRGKTCTNLLRAEPFQCYSNSIKKNCCESCEKVKTGIPSKYNT
ncbi:unnamed protein product [Mytilus coruscus]|uniref:Peptidase M12B domain-containing protein n=1 Tax=Mytilus coruscus TaxID=42192 RepID=A0A6J8A1P7_MYTCO|nr:unnamed protein product [Mytilus coruscus]